MDVSHFVDVGEMLYLRIRTFEVTPETSIKNADKQSKFARKSARKSENSAKIYLARVKRSISKVKLNLSGFNLSKNNFEGVDIN